MAGATPTFLGIAKKSKACKPLSGRDAYLRLPASIGVEALGIQSKGDIWSGDTSHSTFLICAELCADDLLLYAEQAPDEGRFSLPTVVVHAVLGDVNQIAAYVDTSEGPYGLGECVQIQDIVAIGEYICTALWQNLTLVQLISSPQGQTLSRPCSRRSERRWSLRVSTSASRPFGLPADHLVALTLNQVRSKQPRRRCLDHSRSTASSKASPPISHAA